MLGGASVRSLTDSADVGVNRVTWDLRGAGREGEGSRVCGH